MKRHAILDDEVRTQAALYALGTLPDDERTAFGTHLSDCPLCRMEVASFDPSVEAIARLAPPAEPPPAVRERLMGRLGSGQVKPAEASPGEPVQVWKDWLGEPAGADRIFVPGDGSGWESTGVAGVEVRRLSADPLRDRVTMLVRMAAGTSYPAHRHADTEECFVLEGDLWNGDRRMRAGDYQLVRGGAIHADQSTEAGCVLFIVSSLRDELLPRAGV